MNFTIFTKITVAVILIVFCLNSITFAQESNESEYVQMGKFRNIDLIGGRIFLKGINVNTNAPDRKWAIYHNANKANDYGLHFNSYNNDGEDKKSFLVLGFGDKSYFPIGSVGIGTNNPRSRLDINGTTTISGNLTMFGGRVSLRGIKSGEDAPGSHWYIYHNANKANDFGLQFWSKKDGDDKIPYLVLNNGGTSYFQTGKVGIGTNKPQARLDVNGTTRTKLLTIVGGADIVESFESVDNICEPGDIVVIDELNPGQIRLSSVQYDKKVAGVVSGANGLEPGLELGSEVLSGSIKIAMTGRVWVKCNDENGSIQPGDRLTTSSIPGFAMRATNESLAPGAVIGKAMSLLEDSEGFVLVLVNLQ